MFDELHNVILDSQICVYGAREHNLKNINVSIPRNKFVVITGVSGSGKSTLAFDILFSEGQRRFLDSLNAYARQFVEQLPRPNVDLIIGLPPTVSIEQRISRGGGKSTVATVTEIYHFLRLLFSKLGTQYCPDCDLPAQRQTIDTILQRLQNETRKKGELMLLAPVVKGRKGFHTEIRDWAFSHHYRYIRADGKLISTENHLRLDRFREHNIEIVTGSIKHNDFNPKCLPRIQKLVSETLEIGNRFLYAMDKEGKTTIYSTERVCPGCGVSFEPLDPKMFSYNSPSGWCPECRGFGEIFYLPDVDRGARADAIEESWFEWMEGSREICPECNGARINRLARAVRLILPFKKRPRLHPQDNNEYPTIDDFARATVTEAKRFFDTIVLNRDAEIIARDIIPEIKSRLNFLSEVGLDYLQLGRGVTTLSGGEAQRIRLSAQIGSNLCGVLYILDEPTIGLHPRDNEKLISTLQRLRDRGNSVIVVEHDEATIRSADYIIDLGPGAGVNGGEVVATGTLQDILKNKNSLTGQCLKEIRKYPARGTRRPITPPLDQSTSKSKKNLNIEPQHWLALSGASLHNLKNLTVHFPLGRFIVVTGVSGSGKSTLIKECLLPALQSALSGKKPPYSLKINGFETIRAVYEVDQTPIGRTPRSIPATYVGFFDEIRCLFSSTPEARLRGYQPSRFSFNSAQGRCPECKGVGTIKIEMNFLPPAFVECNVCKGLRFDSETLHIKYHNKNIAEVLEMSVKEALEFFESISSLRRPLETLCDTGLDYLKLGQPSNTLSGGEAQRIKLVTHLLAGIPSKAKELSRDTHKQKSTPAKTNLFILEEPTIGLHPADVKRLVDVLQRLVDYGHTVIVIEHNLDLIAEADWIIDLGPEGGDNGGRIVATGTPEDIANNKNSYTGKFLRKILNLS